MISKSAGFLQILRESREDVHTNRWFTIRIRSNESDGLFRVNN